MTLFFIQPYFLQHIVPALHLHENINIIPGTIGLGEAANKKFGIIIRRSIIHYRKIFGGMLIKEILQHHLCLFHHY